LSGFLSALQVALPAGSTQLLWALIILLIIGLIAIVVFGFLVCVPSGSGCSYCSVVFYRGKLGFDGVNIFGYCSNNSLYWKDMANNSQTGT